MAFDREDFDTFWQDWLEINREAQRLGDWGIMADFYEPDATYGYTYSAEDQYMNVGREEIRAGVLGLEMLGFQGWIYPYQAVIFDDRSGQAFGLWRQLTTFNAPDGQPYEIKGLGAAGSSTAANAVGRGSATCSTSGSPPPPCSRCYEMATTRRNSTSE